MTCVSLLYFSIQARNQPLEVVQHLPDFLFFLLSLRSILVFFLWVLEQDVDGLSLTHRAVISCHRSLSMDATVNNKDRQSEEIPSIQRPQQETKFGDKGFLKE
ncbi:uncharacterized protein [Acropora muricata]|uniref:uncharacterized protein isoform X3 n=1 Tax=Acropora muricata TaxID=159855 RepID=UPI0034E548E0